MNAYISYSALDAALKTRDSELKKILNQLSEYLGTIYTDLKPQELMVIMRDSENPLSMLCRQDVKVAANPKLFATLKTNHSSVLLDPTALYIIDLPEATTQMIQNNYGVLCRSVSNPNLDFLLKGNITKTTSFAKTNSWKVFFDSVKRQYIEPVNTVIISDRYLFTDTEGVYKNGCWSFKSKRGLDNCLAIINNLLPERITTPVSILICFDATDFSTPGMEKKEFHKIDKYYEVSEKHFEYLSNELYSGIKALGKKYTINVEMLSLAPNDRTYYKTHNRRIITNYGQLYAEQNLAAFVIDKSTNKSSPVASQNIDYNTLFARGIYDDSDCPIISHVEKINDFLIIFSSPNDGYRFFSRNGRLSDRIITGNTILNNEYRRRKEQKSRKY